MSGYFKGESNFHYHYSVNLKELPLGKRVTAVLCVVLWVPFAALLFLTSHYLIGIMGLVGAIFIYIPLASMYIAGLRGRQRMVPLIMLGVGVLAEIGVLSGATYLAENGFTAKFMAAVSFGSLFLVFFIIGICFLWIGWRQSRKWKRCSRKVLATVVDYKQKKTGVMVADEITPGHYNSRRKTPVFSPILQYVVDGVAYEEKVDSYFGRGQLAEVGSQMEIHVNSENPREFILKLQKGGGMMVLGVLFLVIGLTAAAGGFFFCT